MSDGLLEKVKQTPTKKLGKKVAEVDGLSTDDHDAAKRFGQYQLDQNWVKVKVWFHWVWFTVSAISILASLFGLIWLSYSFLDSVVGTPGETKFLLAAIWNTALIALATLFLERIKK